MGSIQGISSRPPVSAPQLQKPAVPPAPRDRDQDGDVDRPGAIDRDKGNHLDIQG